MISSSQHRLKDMSLSMGLLSPIKRWSFLLKAVLWCLAWQNFPVITDGETVQKKRNWQHTDAVTDVHRMARLPLCITDCNGDCYLRPGT